MSIESPPDRSLASAPRTSSVEPPPMSTTSTGSATASGRAVRPRRRRTSARLLVAGRAPRARRRAASRTPVGEDRRRCAASRVADVAQNRTRWRRRGRAISAAYSSIAANVRSSASSASRPVRSTPWPSRTIRNSRTSRAGRVAQVADQQLDRVGAAVDRGDAAHASPDGSRLDARARRPPVAERVEHLVAERVHARPWASDWPASTCRHLTRSGMPPARDARRSRARSADAPSRAAR